MADGVVQLLHQRRNDRMALDRLEDLAVGASLRALLIYGLTGLLSTLLGTLLGHMVWRAIQ
jgi:hypothetical protein